MRIFIAAPGVRQNKVGINRSGPLGAGVSVSVSASVKVKVNGSRSRVNSSVSVAENGIGKEQNI